MSRYQAFIERKLGVVHALGNGECGGDYGEACILLAAIVSGISADLWPGANRDRVRFIETWVRFTAPTLNPMRVSVPLLVDWCHRQNKLVEEEALKKARPKMFGPGYDALVLTGADVDMTEAEVAQLCPALTTKEIRQHSYPAVFYSHVRSALTHEFHLTEHSAGTPMTERPNALVSYVNMISGRRIHFHLDYLIEVARSIAQAAEPILMSRTPLPVPPHWWIT